MNPDTIIIINLAAIVYLLSHDNKKDYIKWAGLAISILSVIMSLF